MKPELFPTDFNTMLDEIYASMNKILGPCDPDKEAFKLTHELRDVIVEFTMSKSYPTEPDYDMLDAQERFAGLHYDECTGD